MSRNESEQFWQPCPRADFPGLKTRHAPHCDCPECNPDYEEELDV